MKKLLLTGFEPFLDFSINPTAEIIKKLHRTQINDYNIFGEVLSVDFNKSGLQLIELIEKHNPDAVVSLGLAAGRNCVTLERIAINCNDGPADNFGNQPNGEKIAPGGPDAYFTTLPIKDMVRNLNEAGLPAKISNTAGTYLCNNIMYHALHYFAHNYKACPSGFIHLPASHQLALQKDIPSWSQHDLQKATEMIISCL